jgi:hypothetical protein
VIGVQYLGVFLAFGMQSAASVDRHIDNAPRLANRSQPPDPGLLGVTSQGHQPITTIRGPRANKLIVAPILAQTADFEAKSLIARTRRKIWRAFWSRGAAFNPQSRPSDGRSRETARPPLPGRYHFDGQGVIGTTLIAFSAEPFTILELTAT